MIKFIVALIDSGNCDIWNGEIYADTFTDAIDAAYDQATISVEGFDPSEVSKVTSEVV